MRLIWATVVGISLSGCANFNTSTKPFFLPDGEGIAMDAKQRVIFGKERLSDPAIFCAEPSPDALSALGASLAASGTGNGGTTGSLAFGSAEAAAMIGLRTQSIQLLRDLNYRVCESYGNRAISPVDVASLLRRGQSTMMGLMAIEQLTGPVVAHQVTLSAAVNAGKIGPSAQELAAAQASLDQKVAAVVQAESASKASATELAEKERRRDELERKLLEHLENKPSDDADTAVKEAWSSTSNALESQIETAKKDVAAADEKSRSDGDSLRIARESNRQAELNLNAVRNGGVGASGATTSDIELMTRQASVMTENLVQGVSGIVKQVNYSFIIDSCMSLFGDLSRDQRLLNSLLDPAAKSSATAKGLDAVIGTCVSLIEGSKDGLIESLRTPTKVTPTPTPTPTPIPKG